MVSPSLSIFSPRCSYSCSPSFYRSPSSLHSSPPPWQPTTAYTFPLTWNTTTLPHSHIFPYIYSRVTRINSWAQRTPGNLYTIDPCCTLVHDDIDTVFFCLGVLLGMAVASRQLLQVCVGAWVCGRWCVLHFVVTQNDVYTCNRTTNSAHQALQSLDHRFPSAIRSIALSSVPR